jgi:hypothetical protein
VIFFLADRYFAAFFGLIIIVTGAITLCPHVREIFPAWASVGQLVDVGQVPALPVIIKAIANNELIRDFKAGIADF